MTMYEKIIMATLASCHVLIIVFLVWKMYTAINHQKQTGRYISVFESLAKALLERDTAKPPSPGFNPHEIDPDDEEDPEEHSPHTCLDCYKHAKRVIVKVGGREIFNLSLAEHENIALVSGNNPLEPVRVSINDPDSPSFKNQPVEEN